MPLTAPSLAAALAAVGHAYVYIGDAFAVGGGGMDLLGVIDGEVGVDTPWSVNALTVEQTGDAEHQATATAGTPVITTPLVMGDPDLWARISPTGTAGGGTSSPVSVVATTLLVIPAAEVAAGLSFDGTTWTPGAPENAVWVWRAYPMPGRMGYRMAGGGKAAREVVWRGMFDAARPENHKLFTVGDPATQGITTLRI